MLIELYSFVQTKIKKTKRIIQGKHPSKLGSVMLAKFFILELTLLALKYLLILFKNPVKSFKILVNQPALNVCRYSYCEHKNFQKKVRVFSLAGLIVLISATVVSSLVLNLTIGPIFQSRAATYNWVQTSWSGGATASNASHSGNQTGWAQYSAKDSGLSAVNDGADLQLAIQSGTWTVTDSTTGDTGFNNAGTTKTDVIVSGSGSSAGVSILSDYPTSSSIGSQSTLGIGSSTSNEAANPQTIQLSNGKYRVYYSHWTPNYWRIAYKETSDTNPPTSSNLGAQQVVLDMASNYAWNPNIVQLGDGTYRMYYAYIPIATWLRQIVYRDTTDTNLPTSSNLGAQQTVFAAASSSDIPEEPEVIQLSNGKYRLYYSYHNGTYWRLAYRETTDTNFPTSSNIGSAQFIGVGSSSSDQASNAEIIQMSSGKYRMYYTYNNGTYWQLVYRDTTDTNAPSSVNMDTQQSLGIGSSASDQGIDPEILALSNGLYRISYSYNNGTYRQLAYKTTSFPSSGSFTSHVFDMSVLSNFGALSWTAVTPSGTSVTLKSRSSNQANLSDATAWASCTNIINSANLSTGGCVADTNRYIQFQATLSTTDTAQAPILSDVSIAYTNYSTTTQTLTSSAYNTSSSGNVISRISWTENTSLPSGATLQVQLRTAPDSSGSPGTWTSFLGPDGTTSTYFSNSGTGCSKASATVTCATMPSVFTSGSNDQWISYKIYFTSTGSVTPTFSDLTLQYVVNAPPDFDISFNTTGVTATQNSDGTVTIQYRVRDSDTTSGTITQGYITPSFEYSTNGGSSYTVITSAYLISIDLNNKAVSEGTYTTHTATWSPKSQINGNYTTTAKVRVIINDNEAANNTASAASANFTLDTSNPSLGSPYLSINPASARPGTAALTISATDNSSMQMKVGLASDLSDASWEIYSASKMIILATDPDTVYVQFKDAYNNTSLIVSSTTPGTPAGIMIQDTSNLRSTPVSYRLFVAWQVVSTPNPGFKQYNILRSTDNTTFTQIATVNDSINTNYYSDNSATYNQTYYYKVSSQDNDNNISYYSDTIKAGADGIQNLGEGGGGNDGIVPIISSVGYSNIQTTQATITWTTDELANSTVGYSTDFSFSTEHSVASYATSHSVTLINLIPNTAYYFRVKSSDPSGNQAINNNSGNGYMFTTLSGPKITNIDAEIISNTSARIVWYTDIDSNSYVIYSSNSDLSSSTEIGVTSLVSGSSHSYYHAITLTGLIQGTAYYYYVKSTDGNGNVAINNNGTSYYTFKTTQDSVAPIVSNITVSATTPNTAVITWITNEPSTSKIEYGTTTSYGSETDIDANLHLTHLVFLVSLDSKTTYNYRVKSQDGSGNKVVSSNQTFATLEQPTSGIDQTAPIVSNVAVGSITSNSAIITFNTNEFCLGAINYGTTSAYNKNSGELTGGTTHSVTLGDLLASTAYYFQAKCTDSANNAGYSSQQIFTTLAPTATVGGGKTEAEKRIEGLINEKFSPEDIRNAVKKLQSPPIITGQGPEAKDTKSNTVKITWSTDKKANGIIKYSTDASKVKEQGVEIGNTNEQSLTHEVVINNLAPGTLYYYVTRSTDIYGNITTSDIQSFSTLVIPLILNVTIPNVTLTSATIGWDTSVTSTGYVEYGKDTNYDSKKEHDDPSAKGTTHLLNLVNLEPTTTYHFRIKGVSQADSGLIFSEDYTFNTQSLPEIKNEEIRKITDNSAKVTFETNIETDTQVLFKPLKQEDAVYEQKGKSDLAKTHEILIDNLEFGTEYDIIIKVKDAFSNTEEKQLPTFTTGIDLNPPIISLLRTENALIPGKKDKVQTIISWKTDETSTTQIMYQEGIDTSKSELKEKTVEDKILIKDHVLVLTNLKPGTVYQLKAISRDSQDNAAMSKNQTMLTPRQQESVFQIIIKNLEDVFGWVRKIK